MATRIASQVLAVGDSADATAWTPTPEKLTVTFTAVEVTATSVVRCLIKDPSRVLASTILNGSSTKKLSIEGLETAVTVHMEQLQGSAQVTSADGTGGDITADEIATGAVGAAEIATDAVGAAEIAAGAVDSAEIATGAVDNVHLSDSIKTAANVVVDPGTGNVIPVTASASIAITTAAAETNTMAIPTFAGQVISLTCDVYAVGDRVITVAAAFNQAGNTVITMDGAGDHIALIGVQVAGALVWRVLVNDGCTLA